MFSLFDSLEINSDRFTCKLRLFHSYLVRDIFESIYVYKSCDVMWCKNIYLFLFLFLFAKILLQSFI